MRLLYIGDFTEQFAYRLLKGFLQYGQESGEPWVVRRMPPSYREEKGFNKVLEWAWKWKADAVVGQFDPKDPVQDFRPHGIAAVAIDNVSLFSQIPNITAAYGKMGEMAAEHFLNLGFREFGYYGYKGVCWSDGRREGFKKRLEEAGLSRHLHVYDRIRTDTLWAFNQPRLGKWLLSLPKPIAIMCCDDTQGNVLLETCQAYGIRVPFDVAVIGVDNDEVLCSMSAPFLSSIDVDMERGGYQAAKMLDRMVKDPSYKGEDIILPPLTIVTRMSSNVIATRDKAVHEALQFINANADHKILVTDVLAHVPVSRRLLEQRFLKATGTTLYQYIIQVRIDRFAKLLLSSNDSVSNLAAQLDEPDAKTISRRFQLIKGCTPTEYRQRHSRKLGV